MTLGSALDSFVPTSQEMLWGLSGMVASTGQSPSMACSFPLLLSMSLN